jgi:hypothetical protein
VIGVRLRDGRRVVVKVRPASARLVDVFAVQRAVHERGFPCAEPLAGPAPLGDRLATAEAYVPPGDPAPATPSIAATADLLVRLVALAPPAAAHPSLENAPPWAGWDHDGTGVWPWPDDLDVDMNEHDGPAWIDDVARRIRARLAHDDGDGVIGHIDWEAYNLDWAGDVPVLVHDWDSLAIRSESAIAGLAAAVFSSGTGDAVAATVAQTQAFLDAYERSAPIDREVAWTAGLWVLTYNAKKETLGAGGGYVVHLQREFDERLRRAVL